MKKEKTLKKALRQAKLWGLYLVLIGVVFAVVGTLILPDLAAIMIMAGVFTVLVAPYIWWTERKRAKHSFCPSCGKHYRYESDVAWETIDRSETTTKVTDRLEFTCICADCGESQSFIKKFCVQYYDEKKNRWVSENIRTMAKKYFV